MIIKKPYAFLIKNFRLIHGLLFATLLYIAIKSFGIYTFFNEYVLNGYYFNTGDLTSSYINYFMFFAIIISAIVALLIFFILRLKGKETKSYIFLFLTLIVTFIYYIYMYSTFSKLETQALNSETVRVLRDISLIALIPQIILTMVTFTRMLGFNLKQFDFKRDLEELNIDETDNEEVEIAIGDSSYKIARFFRKTLRLLKYFIVENKIFLTGLISLTLVIVFFIVFLRINVYSVQYNENQMISANSLKYNVNSSYITKYDISNKTIIKGKYYLIIDININNDYINDYELSRETFTLSVNDKKLIPNFSLLTEFADLGDLFQPKKILSKTNDSYLIVFELDEKDLNSKYVLYIKNYDSKSISEIDTKFKQIIVKPKNLDELKDKGTYELNKKINLKDSLLKDANITIMEYEISDKFNEKASVLLKNTYKEIYYTIAPNNVGNSKKTILKLKSNFEINTENRISNYVSNVTEFLDNYGLIQYESLGKIKTINVETISSKYNNDKYTYIEVPYELKNAVNIKLLLEIRGLKYTIILK